MNWLSRLERRLGRWSVPHLTEILVVTQLLSWGATLANPGLWEMMPLIPERVMAGEWWRVFSFLFMPPHRSALFVLIALYVLYLMGKALESAWGEFRYNLFWLVGYLLSVAAAFLAPQSVATNGYLVGSVLLAFALLYPNYQFLLFFVLPVKVKWIAWVSLAMYALVMISALSAGIYGPALLILAALTNLGLFFGTTLWQRLRGGVRRRQRQREEAEARETPFHTCSVCRATDKSHPQQEFRYRREAGGVVCYCLDHLPPEA